jgi:hypothetical protein
MVDPVQKGVEPLAEDRLAVGLGDARSPQLVGGEEEDQDATAEEDPAQYAGDEPPSHTPRLATRASRKSAWVG